MNLRREIYVPQEVIKGRDHSIKEIYVKEWQEQNGGMKEGEQGGKGDSSTGSARANRSTIPQVWIQQAELVPGNRVRQWSWTRKL